MYTKRSIAFAKRCINLRKQGYSLFEIMALTKRSKTTVYHHIRNVKLTTGKKKVLRLKSEQNRLTALLRINANKKGKNPFGRHPLPFSTWTPDMVLLIGHLLFDGEFKRTRCMYNNRSITLINRVETLMRTIYEYPPKARLNEMTGVHSIGYYNVELATYVRERAAELLREIDLKPRTYQLAFLRAFFDDEGNIYFNSKRGVKRVRGYQHNKEILLLVQRLLKNFGIEGKIENKDREISITKRASLEQFATKINFSPGLCVNGERSNSIWKESLEKREILRRALASYQS